MDQPVDLAPPRIDEHRVPGDLADPEPRVRDERSQQRQALLSAEALRVREVGRGHRGGGGHVDVEVQHDRRGGRRAASGPSRRTSASDRPRTRPAAPAWWSCVDGMLAPIIVTCPGRSHGSGANGEG
ncbi:MAG TPA: hypothetical protein VFE48_07325 [Methylomirabilota bacterium]|nr:hypothetical protein [Methylomirabilota bacterium]